MKGCGKMLEISQKFLSLKKTMAHILANPFPKASLAGRGTI
jgi:hypothetical protein